MQEGVDNSVGKKNETLIIKNTAKVFKYNAGIDSIVDGNSVQLPFVREYKGDRKTALEYIWYTKNKNGELSKRGILVSGHGVYGVPTLKDYDTLVALERIFINKKTKNGVCELRVDNIDNEYLEIKFTINELARELGYKSPNNLVRDNLKKSVQTLVATTMFSLYEGGIYDIKNKKYIANYSKSFRLLEDCEGFSLEDENGTSVYDVTRIRLSKFIYEQILNDYKLYYNKKIYEKTKNSIARKIYHMALQWKGNDGFAWANLKTLMEKIPMIEEEEKYRKRDIKKALKILNDKEMIKITYDKINSDKVYFIFNDKNEYNILNKYNKYSEVKEAFYALGFTMIEVEEYLEIEDIRYIQALLRYMDVIVKSKTIKYPKKYFLKYLNNKFPLDDRYFN